MPYPRLRGNGTRAGGLKTAAILKERDPDYYKKIGQLGGSKSSPTKGFASMTPTQRSAAGRKGGRMSSRKGIKSGQGTSPGAAYHRRHKPAAPTEPTAYEYWTGEDN